MRPRLRLVFMLCVLLCFVLSSAYTSSAQTTQKTHTIFLPKVASAPTFQPFGFDLRWWYLNEETLKLAKDAHPRWVRAGDVSWSEIEKQPGKYDWSLLGSIEISIKKLRANGIEPVLILQGTPTWARSIENQPCSPPRPEHMGAMLKFYQQLAARYKDGDLAVKYWEVWNEPDAFANNVHPNEGTGCWADLKAPYNGGYAYGEMLKQATVALKKGNPRAQIIGGALIYDPQSSHSRTFLEGMIESGSVHAIDILSFHAYGEWDEMDWLVEKTRHIRAQLARVGLANKALIATEVGAACPQGIHESCDPSTSGSEFITNQQANYAARIFAESIALNLHGAFWYTLVEQPPGFAYSSLVDKYDKKLAPRPAYYAFRNSARLLQDATYVGKPVEQIVNQPADQVRVLEFSKPGARLYVLWVQKTDCDNCVIYNIQVPAGAKARCTTNLDGRNLQGTYGDPYHFNCSDTNRDGEIPRTVGELPQYIEVSIFQ
jgi:hypothetical protein